jgi:hypothetical protein
VTILKHVDNAPIDHYTCRVDLSDLHGCLASQPYEITMTEVGMLEIAIHLPDPTCGYLTYYVDIDDAWQVPMLAQWMDDHADLVMDAWMEQDIGPRSGPGA